MVALQILVLSVWVRVLVRQQRKTAIVLTVAVFLYVVSLCTFPIHPLLKGYAGVGTEGASEGVVTAET